MESPGTQGQKRENLLLVRLEELREEIRAQDPRNLAQRTGALFQITEPGRGLVELQVWDRMIQLTFPELEAREANSGKSLGAGLTALIIYYLHTSSGAPPSGEWISFTDLPDGRFYTQAFQGYTGGELLKGFGDDVEAFERAAERIGGSRLEIGDAAYSFHLLPKVSMGVVF